MRSQLDSAVLEYTHRVVDDHQMATMRYQMGKQGAHNLWSMVVSYHAADSHEEMLLDKALEQLSQISQTHSQRLLFYHDASVDGVAHNLPRLHNNDRVQLFL